MAVDLEAFANTWHDESPAILNARQRGADTGISSPAPVNAAALTVLAAASRASAVVEVGTGTGVTGLSLLKGISSGGVLTSIDADAGQLRTAKASLTAAADDTQVRLIAGDAREVLPRLADSAYDMVVVNESDENATAYLNQSLRLLRVGGVLVFTDATANGTAVDLADRSATAVALRAVSQRINEDEKLASALVPAGTGLLVAVKLR